MLGDDAVRGRRGEGGDFLKKKTKKQINERLSFWPGGKKNPQNLFAKFFFFFFFVAPFAPLGGKARPHPTPPNPPTYQHPLHNYPSLTLCLVFVRPP